MFLMGHGGDSDTSLVMPVRLALAAGIIAGVVLLEAALGSVIDAGSHFLLMGTAVVAVALTAGTAPALLATLAAAILSASDTDAGGSPHTHLLLFVAQAFVLTMLVAALHNARSVADVKSREAEDARREGEAARRLKDEFLATISHELRTPLNAVLGWVSLVRSGRLDAQTSDHGLESIERNVRRQAEITSDLLDMSKALTGRLRMDCEILALADCARQAAQSAKTAARAKGVEIVTDLSDDSIAVFADSDRMRQIARQLLVNAIKFTPRGGRIDLSADVTRDQARLIVRDSGPGIEPAFLPHVFDRFSQADASTTRTVGGLGIGLALVRELVELQGGTISASNATDGTGAVMTAMFPLQPGPVPAPAGAPPIARVTSPLLDGLRVLVVDEDADARDLLRTVLHERGAVVRTVESVSDALEALEVWRPDVLVSDGTTDHDHYSLVGKVQALEADRGGRIPALALTNIARTDRRLRELLAGTVTSVPKPFEPALLTSAIARLAGRERRHLPR